MCVYLIDGVKSINLFRFADTFCGLTGKMADEVTADQEAISPKEAQLEERVKRDPFDAEAWEELAQLAGEGKKIIRVRTVMERLLERFPFAFGEWVRYLELESSLGTEVGLLRSYFLI